MTEVCLQHLASQQLENISPEKQRKKKISPKETAHEGVLS